MTMKEQANATLFAGGDFAITTFTHRGVQVDQVETADVVGWSLHPFTSMSVGGRKNLVVWDSKRNREQALQEIEIAFDQQYADLFKS